MVYKGHLAEQALLAYRDCQGRLECQVPKATGAHRALMGNQEEMVSQDRKVFKAHQEGTYIA